MQNAFSRTTKPLGFVPVRLSSNLRVVPSMMTAKESHRLEIETEAMLPYESNTVLLNRLNGKQDKEETELVRTTPRSYVHFVATAPAEDKPSPLAQALAAVFYASSSLLVIFVNKV